MAQPAQTVSLQAFRRPGLAPSVEESAALETSSVIHAGPGILYGLVGYSNRSSAQFIQIFNSTTVPDDATVPQMILRVGPQSNFEFDLTPYARYFSTGMAWSNSSTAATKTIGAADCWVTAFFTTRNE